MWMLFSGEDENGVGEWERRLRELERSYKRLFSGGLGLYSVEEEIAKFKVCPRSLYICAIPVWNLITLITKVIPGAIKASHRIPNTAPFIEDFQRLRLQRTC